MLAARLAAFAGRVGLAVLLSICVISAPEVLAQDDVDAESEEDEQEEPDIAGIDYSVEISGFDNENLLSLIEASSQLIALESKPPASLGGLRRRADEDVERINAALRSEGYYQGTISHSVDDTVSPVVVRIEIDPGPQTTLAAYDITYLGETVPNPVVQPSLEDLDIKIGMAARAPAIVSAQNRLIALLKERGYPAAAVQDRKTFVDVATDTMTVKLDVMAGRFANFGAVEIKGNEDVDTDYIAKLITWREDEGYDQRLVESTRRALLETGLFSGINIAAAGPVSVDGLLPMAITVTEGPHRTIGFGAEYSTDTGVGGDISWAHRNFFGANETLRTSLVLSQIEQSLQADFRKPFFHRDDQAFLARVAAEREETDAFDRLGVVGYVGLERELSDIWTADAGVSAEYETIKDDQGTRNFFIVGLPVGGHRDTTDNLLNPTEGTRLDLLMTPYGVTGSEAFPFFKSEVGGSAYYAVDEDKDIILAGRAKVGSIVGASTEDLPANKRFYAGGGGSIRGYAFQLVGPLDSDDDPLGGRSLLEFSGEVRIRVTETIGVVPFVDGGTVYDSSYPDFEETIRWAAGLGLRYFTGVGPLRLDVAFPINRRKDVDDFFQFYVSIGQAF